MAPSHLFLLRLSIRESCKENPLLRPFEGFFRLSLQGFVLEGTHDKESYDGFSLVSCEGFLEG